MSDVASLTRQEAEERAALIAVDRYDIAVDMRGLLEGDTIRSTSTIAFTCREPGAATFVDCVAQIAEATLNGKPLDLSTVERGRLPLPALAADNVLVVTASQSDTGSGAGILRTVDPTDEQVYVWTSFEPDDARRVWACFDQPDLKAPHRFTVDAPEAWTVTSNGAPETVADHPEDGRTWTFPDTPPLSTYVVVVNAGPFHEVREERGGYSLGLYCRQSLKQYLERDAEDLLSVTASGLAFFGERFGQPFPQERYDQVFVPNMGGAMENWGCVTWTDSVALPQPAHPHAARDRGERAAARDGPHVVRRPGHDALVGRPVAQRGVRLVGGHVGLRRGHAVRRHVGELPGRPEDRRLPRRHGPREPPDPGRGARRRPGDGELRRDHLRQGRGHAQAAGRLRRRGRLRRGAARLLP